MYAKQLNGVYPVQFFAEDERSGFNWGLAFIDDDTFEAVAPEIATPVMPSVVIPGKADFYFTDKLGKAC